MLLYKNRKNDQSVKAAKFIIRLKQKGLVKAFVCFTDEKGQLKSMTYENGEYYLFNLTDRKIKPITSSAFFQTLDLIKKNFYNARTYGQVRLRQTKQRRHGMR
ncbi:hypothetical protein [Domibacillus robiginosus]|uniref:hypothetical protein n=1 Tax=Domibacillus robiginosus TaxID=1071054 RepID=UPI00067E556B|nr:hypothetical protein [Domibacillus robiginosus]